MRVCRIVTRFPPELGGPSTSAYALSTALSKMGVQVVVVCPKSRMSSRPHQDALFRIEHLNVLPPKSSKGAFFVQFSFFFVIRALIKTIQLNRRERFDVIHAHSPVITGVVALFVSRLIRVPFVYTAHGLSIANPSKGILSTLTYVSERWIMYSAQAIMVVSSWMRETVAEVYHQSTSKVSYIPNGVDPVKFNPTVEPIAGLRQPGRKLITTTTLMNLQERVEGLKLLIEAVADLARDEPNVHLVIVGDGTKADLVRAYATSLGLSKQLTFLGARNDVPNILSATDIFVLSTLREGTPHSVLEAMAMAKPVVGTNVGGIPELIKHGQTGLLADLGDSSSLALALNLLLKDIELAQRLGLAARKEVVEHYDWRIIAEEVLGVYESLLHGKHANQDA